MRTTALIAVLLLLTACGGMRFAPKPPDDVSVATNLAETTVPADEALPEEPPAAEDLAAEASPETLPAETAVLAEATPPRRGGLIGLLRRAIPAPGGNSDPASGTEEPATPVVLAALDGSAAETPAAASGFSLFSRASAPRTGPDARDVPYGTVLPFGEVARVCEARRKPIGRKIESATVRRYKLYDSDPGSLAPRTFYITGFKDDCPRQLTAINVLFGAASFYELLHYGPGGGHMAYGETDRAYEKVKGRVCGVRKGRPCGSKIGQLEKSTFFVNSYLHHAGTGQWAEMLIHDGAILAAALKDSN